VTLGRQLLFAIVADRPLTVAALRQAADSLDVPATMADVVRSFERRAHLPPGSAHWAVAEIATR
jgi:hypothetical protein